MKLSEHILNKAGVLAIGMIEDKVIKGVDVEGKKYKYSTSPFYMPFNGKLYAKGGRSKGNGKLYQIITNKKTGKLGMIVLGGYASIKGKIYEGTENNFLTATGSMLRDMKVIPRAGDANSVVIGFTTPENAQKAFWLNISGVGKRRKLWKFFGLSKDEENVLIQKLQPDVTQEVAQKVIKNFRITK